MSNDTFTSGKRAGLYRIFRASTATLVVLLVAVLGGCRSQNSSHAPSIEFTRIPPAAQGGRERTDVISGRVAGARPGQRIVVYARSGPWWVQPWPEKPFLSIQPDHTWSTPTHLGFEYAALLVDPAHQLPRPWMWPPLRVAL